MHSHSFYLFYCATPNSSATAPVTDAQHVALAVVMSEVVMVWRGIVLSASPLFLLSFRAVACRYTGLHLDEAVVFGADATLSEMAGENKSEGCARMTFLNKKIYYSNFNKIQSIIYTNGQYNRRI